MKLISLNVEGQKHWDLIDPFLDAEQADVICLQEVFEDDIKRLAGILNMEATFMPMLLKLNSAGTDYGKQGIAIFSRSPIKNIVMQNYHVPNKELQKIDGTDEYSKQRTIRSCLLSTDVDQNGAIFTIATTHFTWTPDGYPRDYQYAAAEKLLALLGSFPDIILCGDFNMPRGVNDIYERFVEKYQDGIPTNYASSIDLTLHRAGKDPIQAKKLLG